MSLLVVTVAALLLATSSQRSFVDGAPLNEGTAEDATNTAAEDDSVRELEGLKQAMGKTVSVMKTKGLVYANMEGQKEVHAETQEQVNEDGKVLARVAQHMDAATQGDEGPVGQVRTDFEVPSKGIHKSVVQSIPPEYPPLTENGNRRSSSSLEWPQESGNSVDRSFNSGVSGGTGVQYSPLDMAEYVFWTGDEKGVTLAIEEFLQEGLMSREEAIAFLQEIKYNLDYLKNHYTQLGLNSWEHSKNQETLLKYSKPTLPERPELRSSFDISQLRQEASKKREPELSSSSQHSTATLLRKAPDEKAQDEDYDELLERLRMADFLYTEYSLEEVIYQLAKVMFTQSLTRGSAEAQQALQKFTNFLEVEAEQGHISRALEKKVLDVLIASLSDTLSEHPELLAAARGGSAGGASATNLGAMEGQHFLRQMLEVSPEEKATRSMQLHRDQLKEIKFNNRIPLGIGKYKNP